MEKHVQIALENAKAALAYIDPWATIAAIQDIKRYKMVLAELNEKYGFAGEDSIRVDQTDILCYVTLRMEVPGEDEQGAYDDPSHYMDMPEFNLWRPRKYHDVWMPRQYLDPKFQYSVGFNIIEKTADACRFQQGRNTPYTVEFIASRFTKEQREERLARLIELDAPKIILLHEELKLREWEYMLPVVL